MVNFWRGYWTVTMRWGIRLKVIHMTDDQAFGSDQDFRIYCLEGLGRFQS